MSGRGTLVGIVTVTLGATLFPPPAGSVTAIPLEGRHVGAVARHHAGRQLVLVGSVSRAGRGARVIAIGKDGTSTSARVTPTGRFTMRVRSRAVLRRLVPKRGAGPTLHVLRDGNYVGPIILGGDRRALGRSRKGFVRLRPGLTGNVQLGRFRLLPRGFAAPVKRPRARLISRSDAVRLSRGVPLGAGTQGATGRLRRTATTRRAWRQLRAVDLPARQSGLGADADADGIPNLADVDMNGDQVLDAAQAETDAGGRLSGNEVLSNRPHTAVTFAKILNMSDTGSVNSNRNPDVTWADLTESLSRNAQIETIITPQDLKQLLCPGSSGPEDRCPPADTVRTATMDCGTLSYCQDGSAAIIVGAPGSGLDRTPLSSLSVVPGVLRLPQDGHVPGGTPIETGFQLSFMPKVATSAELQFAGDTFEIALTAADGRVLARQAKVLTSSVATTPEWTTVAGRPVAAERQWEHVITPSNPRAVTARFYRPQSLAPGSGSAGRPPLTDRGGLQYQAYFISSDGRSFYWCRQSQVRSAHQDLTTMPSDWPQGGSLLYDTNVTPPPGDPLAFTVDMTDCLNNPAQGTGPAPSTGSLVTLELESADADGNRTRSRVLLTAP